MLYFVTKAHSAHTIWQFIWGAGWSRVPYLRPITYEQLFRSRRAPVGNYVFTDFDRLTPYEIQCAAVVANRLVEKHPAIRIYNNPVKSLERYALLKRLQAEGINDFGVTRIDGGDRPPSYPVFIRCEDDCKKPDTGLLNSEAEYDAALADMAAKGIPLKRRIAVEYRAEKGEDGYFRKYGGIRLGDSIFPQHILRNSDWYVKRGMVERDEAFQKEFTELFDDFGHRAALRNVFDLAGIDYGRADYAFVNGRMQVYEINTNPTIPKLRRKRAHNDDRYRRLVKAMLDGFAAMNGPTLRGTTVRFELPKPAFQWFPPLDPLTLAYLGWYQVNALGTLIVRPSIPG